MQRSSAVRMLGMIEQHSPFAEGAVLKHSRPWPAYAVAMLVATLDDATRGSVTAEDVNHYLGMQTVTAEGHLKLLTKAGFLARDRDGGWVPIWEGHSAT